MIKKDYYTTIQAAKHLGVSVRTVQLWVENGSLEAWKTAGGHRRIVAESVDGYVHKNQNKVVTSTQQKTILIVEDNPTVCTFYRAAINSWGLNLDVITKQDGFEGLIEIGRQAPDLLISDIYMPGMDGLQMIRSLYKSEQLKSEQIIVISGLSNDNITERGGIPNGIEHFSKPIDVEQLKKVILKKLEITLPNNTALTPVT